MNRHMPKKATKHQKWINALSHNNVVYKEFYKKLDLSGVQVRFCNICAIMLKLINHFFFFFDFKFPIDSSGILQLLKNNKWINAQANLYCLWGNQVYPLEMGIGSKIKSPGNKKKKILHFLNFDLDMETEEKKSVFEVSHCMAIRDMDSFLQRKGFDKNGQLTYKYRKYFCYNCMDDFISKETRDR